MTHPLPNLFDGGGMEGDGVMYMIYCENTRALYIVHSACSQRFAEVLVDKLRKSPELLRKIVGKEVENVFRLNEKDDLDYSMLKILEKNEDCSKIVVPEVVVCVGARDLCS
ncbi:MAG: hypothetical protein C0179_00800 [Fervidicoccus sp.]|nr:MAG: hypothetical protein C0179_00800 [Fervidicoccus sp.]